MKLADALAFVLKKLCCCFQWTNGTTWNFEPIRRPRCGLREEYKSKWDPMGLQEHKSSFGEFLSHSFVAKTFLNLCDSVYDRKLYFLPSWNCLQFVVSNFLFKKSHDHICSVVLIFVYLFILIFWKYLLMNWFIVNITQLMASIRRVKATHNNSWVLANIVMIYFQNINRKREITSDVRDSI